MSIDLHPSAVNTPTGLTKLKVLENYLPRELRSSFKSHAMQQHQHIKSKLKSKLSRSLTSGLHADNLRLLESYVPRHNSSGAMSVSNLLDNDTETTDEYGEPYTEESSAEVDELQDKLGRNGNITSRGERRQAKGILWGTDPTETVLAREERERQRRAEVLSAKLEEDHKRYLSEEEKRREEEKAQILKLKVMNTLFNKNITYENGMAPIVNARWPSHANFVLHANSPTEKELKERNKRIDYNLLATGNVELVDSVPLFKTAGGQKSSMKTTYQAAVSAVSDTRNENDEESSANCQISTAEEYEAQLEGADFEDPNDPMKIKVRSKVREKLNELSRYVNTHSQRKIINAWNSIEGRFKSSPLTKTVMVQGAKGLSYPSKQNALYASTVASVLCSTRVKVGWRELQYVFGQIGITSEETFLARRVAAINLMLSLNRSTSSPIALMMKAELQELQQKSEKLITLEELTEVVFPKDPEERAMEFEIVKSRKQEEVRAMLDEKKRKDELKDVTEARRKRLMLDLESSLKEIQLPRNNINEIKFQAMRSLIEFCQETNAAFLEDQDTNITPEVMGFLGKEAFPKIIVEKVFEKFEKRRKGAINKSRSISITAIDNFSATMMLDGEVEKVKLSGPPNVVALLRETVSYGKGLNGMLFKDVVAMLQCIASTELQTMFRCYSRRYRYTEARRRWKLKESNIKASHFQAWGYLVHHIVSTRDYCWRKVKAWRFFTRRVRERRETFRVCFWPMFTWRKMINASAVAKEKARFLANRIVPTLLTMKTFRGWKKYVQENCALAMIARSFYKKMLQKALLCSLNWLHDWARKRRKIRRAWIREGLVKLRAVQFKRKQTPFMIWRSYTKYRTLVRSRIKSESSPFRHALIGNRSVLKRRSLAEKRLAAGKAYRKEQEENKKRKRDGKKRPPSSAKKRPDSREPSRKGSRSKGSRGRSISDASESSDNDDASAKSASTTNNVHMVFLWLKDVTRNYDMDSDGEDKEDIPNRIATTYSASVSALTEAIRPFPKPFSYLSFLEEYIQEQSHKIYLGYHHTDKWNIFESACRFHRFGWLVFRNLQIYALIKKKVRKFVAKRQRVIKEIVFQALLDLVKTGTRRGALYNLTEAERLNNLVRGHQVNQLVFRRKTSQELKKVIGKTSPSAEEQKRLLAKAKRPFSPSNAVQSKLNERQKHLVGQDGQLYSPPNLLQKDREARVVEERLAKEMLAFSRTIKGQLEAATSEADVGSSEISSTNKKKATAVDEILSMESSITAAAIAKQEEYVSQFKVHAAEILLNVLAKVYVEVQISLVKEETKIYFRYKTYGWYSRFIAIDLTT